jgi:holo-[acyl-carrier protein] synthase
MTACVAGIGVDLVEVSRLRGLLERRPAAKERLFTAQEVACCAGHRDPAPRLAARFAAKEAVGKALGTGVVVWREIEIVGGGRQRPLVRLHGATAAAARRRGVGAIELSLSHTAVHAVAMAAALREE